MPVRLTMVVDTLPELEAAVNGLAGVCQAQIEDPANRGKIKPLYASGVRYKREPPGREIWQPILETLRLRTGDCEDLCGARLGELWAMGETGARARVVKITPQLRHVMVARADGRLEDPSKLLGMGGKSPEAQALQRGVAGAR